MSDSSTSSFQVFFKVIEHHLLSAEVEAVNEQEAAALVKCVGARFERSRDGLQYMIVSGTHVGFHVVNIRLDHEAVEVTGCEPVAKEHSAMSNGEAELVLLEMDDEEPEAMLLSDDREAAR